MWAAKWSVTLIHLRANKLTMKSSIYLCKSQKQKTTTLALHYKNRHHNYNLKMRTVLGHFCPKLRSMQIMQYTRLLGNIQHSKLLQEGEQTDQLVDWFSKWAKCSQNFVFTGDMQSARVLFI